MADMSVGAELRAAREARGLGIDEVAQQTRIPIRHITAIETGDFVGLPAATYSAGFVKTYARLLDLDGQSLSQQFRAELADTGPAPTRRESYEPADPARTPGRWLAWAGLVVALVVVLGYLYWRGTALGDNPAKLAAEGPSQPVPAPEAAPKPAVPVQAAPPATPPATDQPAVLTATSAVWIKVYEAGGPTLFMGVLEPGKSFAVPATAADPRLQTGRPNALTIMVGNSSIPALGPPERLVKDVSLKPAALLARLSAGDRPPVPAGTAPDPNAPATPVETSAAPQ